MEQEATHLPVLLDVCVDLLSPALQNPGSVMIDGTLGLGGHTEAVLNACPNAKVIGIDRDPQALSLATKRLRKYGHRFTGFYGTYDQIEEVARLYGRDGLVDAVLMDLGVSSLQLDEAERGFAYSQDGPLDMRMDSTQGMSAAEYLNVSDEREIARVLRVYGEERFAGKIASAIVQRRSVAPIETTSELQELVRDSLPAAAKRKGGNPSKRTFQAIRIAVNDELRILEQALPAALRSLVVGGRIVVEAYHSLEDRMVKRLLNEGFNHTAPAGLPFIPAENEPRLKALVRGAMKANDEEIAHNPRAKSVRLRAAEVLSSWETK